jgi:hypothetical protein
MASADVLDNSANPSLAGLSSTFKPGDFGLNAMDLQDMDLGDADDDDLSETDEDEENETVDSIAAERKRRQRWQDMLKRTAGEPVKSEIKELGKMMEGFMVMVRVVLAS